MQITIYNQTTNGFPVPFIRSYHKDKEYITLCINIREATEDKNCTLEDTPVPDADASAPPTDNFEDSSSAFYTYTSISIINDGSHLVISDLYTILLKYSATIEDMARICQSFPPSTTDYGTLVTRFIRMRYTLDAELALNANVRANPEAYKDNEADFQAWRTTAKEAFKNYATAMQIAFDEKAKTILEENEEVSE